MLIHHNLLKKDDLANLKSKVDKLDIDKLDADKLKPVPTDLSKLSNVVKNDVVKKDVFDAKMKGVEDKTTSIANLATNVALNAKIGEFKNEIPSLTTLAITGALTVVDNKIFGVSNLVKKAD